MLPGTVLDVRYIAPSPTNDIAYATFLPTCTATAWNHNTLPADLQKLSLEQVVQQSRDFAFGGYRTELLRREGETVGRYVSRLIGITGSAANQREDDDPPDVAPSGAFMSAFMRYLAACHGQGSVFVTGRVRVD